ncbi:hypothetical protein CE91St46_04470 [Eubacteriales bacterium]|nr:hypothetical protein CE91St46_04470 [Eubacteriales bacterium]GKH61978.1 hypothetical protein CE91St47_04470 [Eubacteriales bacterium]
MKKFFSMPTIMEKSKYQQLIVFISFLGALVHIYNLGIAPMNMWPYRTIHLA